MIKLFWNTHNQKKSNSSDKKIKKKEDADYGWGIYHKKNSNVWIYEILKKIKYEIIESEINLEKNDTLIIVDSSVEKKIEFYSKIKLICSKIFLFHLGDEFGSHNLSPIYFHMLGTIHQIWKIRRSLALFNGAYNKDSKK